MIDSELTERQRWMVVQLVDKEVDRHDKVVDLAVSLGTPRKELNRLRADRQEWADLQALLRQGIEA